MRSGRPSRLRNRPSSPESVATVRPRLRVLARLLNQFPERNNRNLTSVAQRGYCGFSRLTGNPISGDLSDRNNELSNTIADRR